MTGDGAFVTGPVFSEVARLVSENYSGGGVDQSMANVESIEAYGNTAPNEFAGYFLESSDIVVLFTGREDLHREALTRLAPYPSAIKVRRGDRSLQALRVDLERIRQTLRESNQIRERSSGIERRSGQYKVVIEVYGGTSLTQSQLTTLLTPAHVEIVNPADRPRRYLSPPFHGDLSTPRE
jgi:hypothetical protein